MADELDNIALRILDLLAGDGRMSYQAIADHVGLSRPAVMERVTRLEKAGYITGYHAHIDRACIGLRNPGEPVSTRTTIVLSTVFEKPGVRPGAAAS